MGKRAKDKYLTRMGKRAGKLIAKRAICIWMGKRAIESYMMRLKENVEPKEKTPNLTFAQRIKNEIMPEMSKISGRKYLTQNGKRVGNKYLTRIGKRVANKYLTRMGKRKPDKYLTRMGKKAGNKYLTRMGRGGKNYFTRIGKSTEKSTFF